MNSGVSLAALLLGGVGGVLVGVAYAVARQWLRDLRDTKAKIVVLRKGLWASAWRFAKLGALALAALVVVGWWAYRDATDHQNTPLAPASTRTTTR